MVQTAQNDSFGVTNIWAMEKDQSIKHLLLLLIEQLGKEAFLIDSRIDTDMRAVYLCHSDEIDVRAYLYTLGQTEGHYGVHLEYPESSETNPIYDAFENLPLQSLVDILAIHFDVDEIQPLPVLH